MQEILFRLVSEIQIKIKIKNYSFYKSLFLPSALIALTALSGCKKTPNNSLRDDAVDLYRQSVMLIAQYTDSFNCAKDSAKLLELNERFEHDLTALNFKYPSETCLEISEGENDTLTNLTDKIVSLRDSLLYRYANPIQTSDSIPSDSIILRN